MRTTKIHEFARSYLKSVKMSLDKLPLSRIEETASILYKAYNSGKKVILMGNGGSAAAASHFASDLAKGMRMPGKKKFKTLSMCDNISMITTYANDCGYENIFREQLANWVEKSDVVMGISASGNSKNVLNAIKVANKASAITIGLTGAQGGKLKRLASRCIVVPEDNMERIEDIHLIVLHILKLYLISLLKEDKNK